MKNRILRLLPLMLCLLLCVPGLAEDAEDFSVREDAEAEAPDLAYDLPQGFVYVRDVIPDVIEEIRYATTHNFTGEVVDGYEKGAAILTEEAAQALQKAADIFRADGYRIKIYDAYRPKSAVRFFVKWSGTDDMRMREEFYPEFRNKTLLVDQGYIARNSAHTRGSALDMTITDLQGREVDMGTGFDYFGKLAWHGAAGITEAQAENRLYLKTVMESCGFKPFQHEWWHYRLLDEPYKSVSFDFPVR